MAYAKETKRAVAHAVVVGGKSARSVGLEMGIPESTCQAWVAEARQNPRKYGILLPEAQVPASQVAAVVTQHRNLGADIGFSDGVEAMRQAMIGALIGFRAVSGKDADAEYERLLMVVRNMNVSRTP